MSSMAAIFSPASPACPFQSRRRRSSQARVFCERNPIDRSIDRREVLVGVGLGLGLSGSPALCAPIQAPDLSKCKTAGTKVPIECCPPYPQKPIVDYVFPTPSNLRVRPAAHLVDADYIAKYELAIQKMRDLPKEDPRSLIQQANVHCAYCSNAYEQVGFPNLNLQVHTGWLFFPFHRFYLYFHERILGSLIGDDSFALPFWNWDSPAGMSFPAIFENPSSSLYDPLRLDRHKPPALIDFDLRPAADPNDVIDRNLRTVRRSLISDAATPEKFFGKAYRAGSTTPGQGSIENTPHTPVHRWVGMNMGSFDTAGRDPVFYCHHANVDRMWTLWKNLDRDNVDFDDPDYLDSAFLFYDENAQMVRVKVRDCLDNEKLGFTYQEVEKPWLDSRLQSRAPAKAKKKKKTAAEIPPVAFPLTLSSPVTVAVQRPKISKNLTKKEKKRESLVIDGIELEDDVYAQFDVYLNDGAAAPEESEFVGSFFNLPLGGAHGKMKTVKTAVDFGLRELIETLELENEVRLPVTLVPREGKGEITIGGVRIDIS